MANYTVGALIRDARERQKYSQEELSYGICTPSTLSRIENGIQIPGKKILQGLFQRLGIIDQIHDICLSKAEMEQYEMEQHLIRCLGKKEYGKAEQLVCTLEEIIQKKPYSGYSRNMEQQYLCFARVLICKNQGESAQKILEQLLEVIQMTIPEFDGLHIRTRLLTYQEISILNNIACSYHAMGDTHDAFHLLFELKEYMEKHPMNGQELSVKYPMILQNLSSWLGQEGYYQDALALCQKGIDFCIEYGKMHTFPMLLCNKACALAELGQIEMSKEFFDMSTAVFLAVGQRERAEQVKKYAQNYGIVS